MGSEFLVYLRLGFEHISDLAGYDHILFIAALCAVYQLEQWKHLLWLITAFTIGHSITLALSTLNILTLNETLIEFLIPVTIVITSALNITEQAKDSRAFSREKDRSWIAKYVLALGFGLIHGMGFSNYLRAVLGGEESILVPLFAFNVGLELGQILILFAVLLISFVMVRFVRMEQKSWALVLSGATGGIALTMMLEKILS